MHSLQINWLVSVCTVQKREWSNKSIQTWLLKYEGIQQQKSTFNTSPSQLLRVILDFLVDHDIFIWWDKHDIVNHSQFHAWWFHNLIEIKTFLEYSVLHKTIVKARAIFVLFLLVKKNIKIDLTCAATTLTINHTKSFYSALYNWENTTTTTKRSSTRALIYYISLDCCMLPIGH